jgi:SPP1 gp7 family putative phage head morphogenesis protein
MDVLTSIRAELDKALAEGKTMRQFSKELAPTLKKLGWWGKQVWVDGKGNAEQVQLGSMHRLNNIYRNNLQTAYMSGRYREQLANAKNRPFWMYIAIQDSQTRPSHSRLNGRIFHFEDPIWQHIYPPNGWGCRCRVRALTQAQVTKMGRTVEDGSQYLQPIKAEAGVDKKTGEVIEVDHIRLNLPGGKTMQPDVGWAHSPGAAAFGTDAAVAQKLGQAQDIELRSQLIQSLNNSELRQAQFANWVDDALQNRRPGNSVQTLGFMTPSITQAVTERLGKAPTSLLVIGEKQLLHADSIKHQQSGVALSKDEYQQLAMMLANPEAVLWDKQLNNLLYIFPDTADSRIKIIINTSWNMKKLQPLDTVINAFKVPVQNLNEGAYDILQGSIQRQEK